MLIARGWGGHAAGAGAGLVWLVQDPLAELAGYFCRGTEVPDRELIRLAAAARAGSSRWDGIAAACGIRDDRDITGVLTLPCWH